MSQQLFNLASRALEAAEKAQMTADAAELSTVVLTEMVKLQEERIQKLEEKIRDSRRAISTHR